jgi:transcriptional regulator with XRE-family HTH domain
VVATGGGGPAKRKSRLGKRLRELREKAGKDSASVEARLRCSQAKVSRFERGGVLISLGELETLLAFYEVDEDTRTAVLSMWEDARVPSKKVEGLSELPRRMQTLVKLQNEASVIKYLQPLVVPGLMQTEEYATAIHEADEFIPEESVARSVAIRLRRQQIMEEPRPPQFRVVLDEAVIRRVVGTQESMARQLERIIHLNERDNVTIQVRPFTAGAYGTMSGAVTILEFPDEEDPASVYLEYPAGGEWVEDPASVASFESVFDDASRTSLSASETNELISARIAELRIK